MNIGPLQGHGCITSHVHFNLLPASLSLLLHDLKHTLCYPKFGVVAILFAYRYFAGVRENEEHSFAFTPGMKAMRNVAIGSMIEVILENMNDDINGLIWKLDKTNTCVLHIAHPSSRHCTSFMSKVLFSSHP